MGISTIIMFSVILWVFLDRAKKLWANITWGKWITNIAAAAAGLGIAFGYGMDLLVALGIESAASVGGMIFAGLAIAGGSSVIHEVITSVNGLKENK